MDSEIERARTSRPDARDREGNLETCARPELWTSWFAEAEASMASQWDDPIWPLIRHADRSSVLELAPGAGRNSARLKEVSRSLHLVDLNRYALDRCRERFRDHAGPCEIHYHENDGQSLACLPDDSISLVYSWDSMVHFERSVVGRYVKEFARVMKPGAWGFVHHSNYGTTSDDPDIEKAPHLRSNLTAELFGRYCRESGLERTDFIVFDWGGAWDSDCISLFFKPHAGRPLATWFTRRKQRRTWDHWMRTRAQPAPRAEVQPAREPAERASRARGSRTQE
jgi:SAM-dependent methyltransferase